MRYCSGCGGNILDNTSFCPYCGSTASKEAGKPTAISDLPNTVLTTHAPIEVNGTDEDEDSEPTPLIILPEPFTNGQVPANTVPMVQSTPPVNGVPMVQSNLQAPTASVAGQPGAFNAPPSAPFQAAPLLKPREQYPHQLLKTPREQYPHQLLKTPREQYPHQLPKTPTKLSTPSPHKSHHHHRRIKGLHHPLVRGLLIIVPSCVILATFIAILQLLFPPALALQGNSTLTGATQALSGGTLQVHGDHFIPLGHVNLTLDKGIPIFALKQKPLRTAQSGTGADLLALHLSSSLPGNQFPSPGGPVVVGIDGTFNVTITVSEQWALGEHTLHATEQITGRSTSLTFKILPRVAKLKVSSDTLDFGQMQMGSNASLSLVISNAGQQTLSWQATTEGTAWLKLQGSFGKIEPGALQQVLDVTANVTHLTPGMYTTTLRVTSNGGNVPVAVKVEVVKHRNPQVTLHVTPSDLSFGSIAIGQQSTLVVTVANLGTQSLNWDATAGNTSWLTLSTTTGTITAGGLPQTINVTADTTHLAPQSYTTALQINSNGGSATVAVTLIVTTVTQTPSVAGQSKPTSGPTPTPTQGPAAPLPTSGPTPTPTQGPAAPLPTSGPTPTPTQGPAAPLPTLVVSPPGFNANTNCTYSTNQGWGCDATISSLQSAKTTLNWSVTASGLNNVTFQPARGILSPGQTMHVTIRVPDTVCPANGDFAFRGPANVGHVLWTCTASQLIASPATLSSGCLSCTVTLSVAKGSEGSMNWSASSSKITGVTFSPSHGTLTTGKLVQVLITLPSTVCPSNGDFAFTGPNNTAHVAWNCIRSKLTVTPTNLNFGTLQIGQQATQTVTVGNSGGQPLTWTANKGSVSWLTLSNSGSTLAPGATATMNVTVNTTGLTAGLYSASVNINSNGGNLSVAITLTVASPPASLSLKPTSLSFNVVQGTTTTSSQTLTVTNTGGQPLTWTAQTDGTRWLTLTNAGSTLAPGATATVTLTVNPTGLAAQVYSASVTINSNGGKVQVAVVLTVTPASTATYTATTTIPVPPASTYAGSAGGDSWALAMTPTAVYTVYHIATTLQVACHLQKDASSCWNPETITDTSGNNFATSAQPGLWLDQASGRLYVFATRTSDATGGVVCIDTTQAASNPNPFCGFTALTAVGDAPPQLYGISGISNPVVVGARWYAFNYVSGASVTGTQNKLLCFSLTTFSACGSQPFSVAIGSGSVSDGVFPLPSVAAIGSQVIVPITVGETDELACFDGSGATACSGTWPVALSFTYDSNYGAPFPLMTGSGSITGLCLPSPGAPCYSLSGATVSTPAGMTGAISQTSGWDGPAFVLGSRVYVPDGNNEQVDCYDYNSSQTCANFPKSLSNMLLLYTVNADPQRPTCIWVNSDSGADQIQNFDAYTGGACGQGPIRVLASSMVVPSQLCTPYSYIALQVLSPSHTSYKSGSVAFDDGNGNPIPGIQNQPLDSSGKVDLSALNLSTGVGLPQFLITLNGIPATPTSVTVQLTWTGINDPSCVPGK